MSQSKLEPRLWAENEWVSEYGSTSHQHKIDYRATEQRKQKVSREIEWDDIIAEKLVCKINKFETLLFCANNKKFSFW